MPIKILRIFDIILPAGYTCYFFSKVFKILGGGGVGGWGGGGGVGGGGFNRHP